MYFVGGNSAPSRLLSVQSACFIGYSTLILVSDTAAHQHRRHGRVGARRFGCGARRHAGGLWRLCSSPQCRPPGRGGCAQVPDIGGHGCHRGEALCQGPCTALRGPSSADAPMPIASDARHPPPCWLPGTAGHPALALVLDARRRALGGRRLARGAALQRGAPRGYHPCRHQGVCALQLVVEGAW